MIRIATPLSRIAERTLNRSEFPAIEHGYGRTTSTAKEGDTREFALPLDRDSPGPGGHRDGLRLRLSVPEYERPIVAVDRQMDDIPSHRIRLLNTSGVRPRGRDNTLISHGSDPLSDRDE